jgi:hypothetical protein
MLNAAFGWTFDQVVLLATVAAIVSRVRQSPGGRAAAPGLLVAS